MSCVDDTAAAAAAGAGVRTDEDSPEMDLSHLAMIGPHYWLPGQGVPPAPQSSPPLWYPYLPAYSPQAAAAAAAAALAGGYKLVPDSATGHCYIIPGQWHDRHLFTNTNNNNNNII